MPKLRRRRSQPRIPLGRIQSSTGLHPELDDMVREDAATSGRSTSWILNDAVASYYKMNRLSSAYIDAQRHKNGVKR